MSALGSPVPDEAGFGVLVKRMLLVVPYAREEDSQVRNDGERGGPAFWLSQMRGNEPTRNTAEQKIKFRKLTDQSAYEMARASWASVAHTHSPTGLIDDYAFNNYLLAAQPVLLPRLRRTWSG